MADFYLDTSAIGNEYEAYADTPTTWGVPQDGNGKAADASSAAVAIATIDVAGCSASGTGTIGIFGVTVSSTLNASGSALATAIASAINAATGAVTSIYSALLLPINRLVYARVNPGLNTQVQVMLRIAGADWVSFSPTQANITPAATISNFAGGADGPFAYLFNTTAVFGKAALAYGIFTSTSSAITNPGADDVINVRTERSGTALSVSYAASSGGINIRTPASSNKNFLFDNGAIWIGDDGQFTITLDNTTASTDTNFSTGSGARLALIAATKDGLLVKGKTVSPGYACFFGMSNNSGTFYAYQVKFEQMVATGNGIRLYPYAVNTYVTLHDCHVLLRTTHGISANTTGLYDTHVSYLGTTFEWQGIGANVASLITFSGNSSRASGANFVKVAGCKFIVDAGAYALAALISGGSNITTGEMKVVVENNIGLPNPSAGFGASGNSGEDAVFIWRDQATGSFRHETPVVSSDWVSSNASAYPTLYAVSRYGVPMGMRFSWEAARLVNVWRYTAEAASISTFYREASATKTCSIELLVPTAEIPYKSQIGLLLTYTDVDGNQRIEESFTHRYDTTALADGVGTGSWTLNGVTGVSSKCLSVTTAYEIKINTEVSAKIILAGNAPTGTRVIYLSPEVTFS